MKLKKWREEKKIKGELELMVGLLGGIGGHITIRIGMDPSGIPIININLFKYSSYIEPQETQWQTDTWLRDIITPVII